MLTIFSTAKKIIEIAEFDNCFRRTQQFGHYLEQLLPMDNWMPLICRFLYRIFLQTSHLFQRLVFYDYSDHRLTGALTESLTQNMDN